jgi:hypothetical protein
LSEAVKEKCLADMGPLERHPMKYCDSTVAAVLIVITVIVRKKERRKKEEGRRKKRKIRKTRMI